MSEDLERLLDDKYDQYLSFGRGAPIYPAIRILAEVFRCVSKLDASRQKVWRDRIDAEELDDDALAAISAELDRQIFRVRRLLSIGDVWIFEEIVLLLTLRIEIELVIDFLLARGYISQCPDLKGVDTKLYKISREKSNKQAYAESRRAIRSNWGLPISSQFL